MLATIGYEGAKLEDFIATLKLCEIDVLVDIRDRAQSRRPGFSKSGLSQSLAKCGIDYLHLRNLGDPKEGRDAARSGDFARFRQIFSTVMRSDHGKSALSELVELASEKTICLMCFERDQLTCHRKMVSDYLEPILGGKAQHLGVRHGVAGSIPGRVRHSDKGATPSFQPVF